MSRDIVLVSSGYDMNIRFWADFNENQCKYQVEYKDGAINALEMTPNKDYVAFATGNSIKFLDLHTLNPTPVTSIDSHEGLVSTILIPQSFDNCFISAGEDSTVRINDIRAGKGVKVFYHSNYVNSVAIANNNKDLICADENGVIITPFTLDYGNYELEEIDQVINGYLWNKETYKFKIDENTTYINDKEQGLIFEINFENKKVKGCVEIIKKGENDLKYLENIKFGLYANEDFYGDDNKIIYKKGDLIDYKFTDKEGKIIFDNLELGKYYVKELQTLKEFVLDKKKYSFELKYKDQYTDVVHYNLNLVNYLKKGELILIKTDNDSGKVIPNTKRELYSENDLLIYSGLTDNNGIINIKDLPYGKYYIVEKLAAPGYINNNEKIYFEIKEDKEIINVNMTNRKMEVEVPSTFKNDLISEILSGVSLITFSLLVYERKKIFIL